MSSPTSATPLRHLIAGKWAASSGPDTIDVVDPRTEERIATIPAGHPDDARAAVAAAAAAQSAWATLTLDERLVELNRVASELDGAVDELAELERQEMGRPMRVGREWILSGIAGLRKCIEDARSYPFERVIEEGGVRSAVVRRPVGVVALIVPWNFSTTSILTGIGPLLAAGNTVVLKPSELSPLSATRLLEIAGFPPGVVNLLLGDARAGAALVADPAVELVHFTGSTAAGRAIAATSAEHVRRTVLELGGKDAAIVDAGVDVARVAADVAEGAFLNTGQICTSVERIYVHRDVASAFVEALVRETRRFDPELPDPLVGPLASARQRALVAAHVDEAVAEGATVETGGVIPEGPGFFYPPTVLTNVTDDMRVVREETFGPVAPVLVVESFEDALARAAATDYGLTATVYTADARHAEAAGALPVGLLWINKWRAGGRDLVFEPARHSGMTAIGHVAAFDAATRPMSIVRT